MAILGTMLGYITPRRRVMPVAASRLKYDSAQRPRAWSPFQRLLDRLRRRKQEPPAPPAQPPVDSTG